MVNSRYIAFLRELIQQTKDNHLEWNYLDENKGLCEKMKWAEKNSFLDIFSDDTPFLCFNCDDSFYVSIDGTTIVILVEKNNPADVYVIPSTFKKIVVLRADEYGQWITRLLNIVQSKFPDGDAFIREFLQKPEIKE